MTDARAFARVVQWSDEDGCYVGTSPGLLLGGVHGTDERQVFDDLCRVIEEIADLQRTSGMPLPTPESPPTG